MYKSRHLKNDSRKRKFGKAGTLVLSLLLLVAVAAGGTIAWLSTKTGSIENKFTPSQVSCEVDEVFQNNVKSSVIVKNNSNIDAYIRVKLVTYRVNDKNQHIGGEAPVPNFSLRTNWIEYEGYYYYTLPVTSGEYTPNMIKDGSSISLTGSYSDADGGKQVIEVMAEAIQSVPAKAVGEAWGVSISEGSVTACRAGN